MAAETTGPSSTLAEAGEPKGLTISVKQMNSDTYRVSLLDTVCFSHSFRFFEKTLMMEDDRRRCVS